MKLHGLDRPRNCVIYYLDTTGRCSFDASRRLLPFFKYQNSLSTMLVRNAMIAHYVIVLLLLHSVSSQTSVIDKRSLVNSCIDGNNHKREPGPEDSLHQQVIGIGFNLYSCLSQNVLY